MSQGLRDVVLGTFALLCSLALWWETTKPQYHGDNFQDYGFDPAFYPRILIAIWALLAIGVALRGLREMNVPMPEQNWLPLGGSVVIVAAYMVAMDYIGFLFASVAFSFVIMPFLGFRNPIIVGLVAILFPLATWYCFVFLLKIPLPTSPFFVRM